MEANLNFDLNSREVILLVEEMLNKKINDYKLTYMKEWERNHSFDGGEIQQKINALELQKSWLNDQIKNPALNDSSVDFNHILTLIKK